MADITNDLNRKIYQKLRDKDIRGMNDREINFVFDYLFSAKVEDKKKDKKGC